MSSGEHQNLLEEAVAEIERLKEALEFYANSENWLDPDIIVSDGGLIAEKTLKGENHG